MNQNEIALTHLYIMLRISEDELKLYKKTNIPPELVTRIASLKAEIAEKENHAGK